MRADCRQRKSPLRGGWRLVAAGSAAAAAATTGGGELRAAAKERAAADRRCDRTFAPTCGCYQDGGSILRTQRTISISISRYQSAFRSTPVQFFCGENSKHGKHESAVDVRGCQAKSGAQENTQKTLPKPSYLPRNELQGPCGMRLQQSHFSLPFSGLREANGVPQHAVLMNLHDAPTS